MTSSHDWPRFVRVRQRFAADRVADARAAAREGAARVLAEHALAPGARVAITAGSRGVAELVQLYRGVADAVRVAGAEPFLFTAMGSHGGGTADGQRALLASLGVTEETVGMPVSCSSDAVRIGETEKPIAGLPVYVAPEAADADGVLVVNRVKPHTSFHGPYESGLLKMLAVGMGRPAGASMVHRLGWAAMGDAILSVSAIVRERLPVLGAVAVVENAYEQPAVVEGVPADALDERETALLERARAWLPTLPVDELDVCVVREMGKNLSGTGMDTNVIGRLRVQGIPEPPSPRITYLGVLDLSDASHGNATGIGLADFTTARLVAKIDQDATNLNCLTTGSPIRAAVPMTLATDRALSEAIWQALRPERGADVRAAVVANTLHLDDLWLSERSRADAGDAVDTVGEPVEVAFADGRLVLG